MIYYTRTTQAAPKVAMGQDGLSIARLSPRRTGLCQGEVG